MNVLSDVYADQNKIIIGQQIAGEAGMPNETIEDFLASTGEEPGILGLDLGVYGLYVSKRHKEIASKAMCQLVDYCSRGGILTISSHWDNPADATAFVKGSLGTFESDEELDAVYRELYTEGSEVNSVLMSQLAFDGDFLEFPDMNHEIKLKKHQKDSVARIIMTPNTLLAHDVGAGKTYTMIAAGMELRRLGKSKKNLYVIPNNVMAQWVEMFHKLYPEANILVVNNRNFCLKKRTATLKKIVEEDFDAILITYSCFDMLSLSKRYYKEFYEDKMKMLDKASANFYSKADIDRKRASVMKIMEKLQEDMTKNVCDIPFDDLGINTMFVDEAHNYKNVHIESGITRVKGFNSQGSLKCNAMMDKVHCVQRMNHGGRVILATGTPITNSITDLFVLQKYLQDGELEFLGIQNFDSWVGC